MDSFFSQPLVVENVGDLARVYRHLVNPVAKIEDKVSERDDKQTKLEQARNTLKNMCITPFGLALGYTIALAIPFIVLFILFIIFKKNPEGIRYISAYPDWFIVKFKALDHFCLFLQAHLGMGLGSILSLIVSFLVIFGLAPVIMFLLPAMFVVALVVSIRDDIIAASRRSTYPAQIKNLDAEISDDINVISEAIDLVPPDYRSSAALEYMSNAIESKKAESLKEAMLQYDEYVFREEMKDSQQQIISKLNNIIDNQMEQSKQLNKINKNVSSINSKLNWMMFFG